LPCAPEVSTTAATRFDRFRCQCRRLEPVTRLRHL
jgi:hypothetical protein